MKTVRSVARRFRPALWFLGPAVTLVAIAGEVGEPGGIRWDGSLFASLQHIRAVHVAVFALVLFTVIGGGAGLLAMCALPIGWLASHGRLREASFVGISVVGAGALGRILKDTVSRARPEVASFAVGRTSLWMTLAFAAAAIAFAATPRWRRPAIYCGVAFATMAALNAFFDFAIKLTPKFDSFPSGHAIGSMALGASLVVLAWRTPWRWKTALGASVFVFVVGLSRVSLGFHYATDIVAGWSLSLAFVTLLAVVMRPARSPAYSTNL
jgi:membrane-associated phospholipid phosphatase